MVLNFWGRLTICVAIAFLMGIWARSLAVYLAVFLFTFTIIPRQRLW